ncbi:hypothetical protein, partial [uncultured Xanthomonas sp.]|uniref:hypothetical protein n=1 Tax=uncultured Xanthomonas sp. TaxID=152831 RepID=UPI0025FAA43F
GQRENAECTQSRLPAMRHAAAAPLTQRMRIAACGRRRHPPDARMPIQCAPSLAARRRAIRRGLRR